MTKAIRIEWKQQQRRSPSRSPGRKKRTSMVDRHGRCIYMTGERALIMFLDIGGEGRYREAWNLNPSAVKTLGPNRGQPIQRRIAGRAEAIPMPDDSVLKVIVERTPLRAAALHEIARVIADGGIIILRHMRHPYYDPHSLAKKLLPGKVQTRSCILGRQELQETEFHFGGFDLERSNPS